MKTHIQKLYQKKAANRYFTSRAFLSSMMLTACFALWTGVVSSSIAEEIVDDYNDNSGHPFAIIPAFIALIGPVGLLGSTYAGFNNVINYQSNIDARIARDLNLLECLQMMA